MKVQFRWGADDTDSGVSTDLPTDDVAVLEHGFGALVEAAWAKYSKDVLRREPDWRKLRSMAESAMYANTDEAQREYDRLTQ